METRLNSSYKQIKTQGCIDAQLVITIYKTVVCVLNGLIFFIIIIMVGQYLVYYTN